jgi:hypothetical protein
MPGSAQRDASGQAANGAGQRTALQVDTSELRDRDGFTWGPREPKRI